MTVTARKSRIRNCLWLAGAILTAYIGVTAYAAVAHQQHGARPPQHRTSTPIRTPHLPDDLVPMRDALLKYQDPLVAVRDGYFSTLGCVEYPAGGMGVHFLNPALIGPTVDPLRPQILVYEPDTGGRLRLVAAEWFVPLATGIKDRPILLGRPFDGPMEGHEPLMPKELHHYDLHVWLFKDNPEGLFKATNPNVGCAGNAYPLMENPTAIVKHSH